jgi:hypothetical protein
VAPVRSARRGQRFGIFALTARLPIPRHRCRTVSRAGQPRSGSRSTHARGTSPLLCVEADDLLRDGAYAGGLRHPAPLRSATAIVQLSTDGSDSMSPTALRVHTSLRQAPSAALCHERRLPVSCTLSAVSRIPRDACLANTDLPQPSRLGRPVCRRPPYVESLHLRVQRGRLESQHRRSTSWAADSPPRRLERSHDRVAFRFREWQYRRRSS